MTTADRRGYQQTAGIGATAELWCHAPPAVIGQRYRARLGTRSAGHPAKPMSRN